MEDALKTNSWLQPNTFMDIISPQSSQASARSKPERSSTLMRSAVKKPNNGASHITPQPTEAQQPAISSHRTDLAASAVLTDRSPLVSRYSPSDYQDAQTVQTDLAKSFEAPEPAQAPDTSSVAFESMDAQPMAVAIEQPSINIFKNAVNNVDYARPVESTSNKWSLAKRLSGWSVLAVVLIGLAAGGIFINRNLNRVELYLASSKAGFAATLPSDTPAGYSLKSISTGSGAIEASFNSNTDNRSYTISEKKSASASDVNSYVQSQAGLNFQAVNINNKTIYIYNGHNATWLSNGIWYILQDNNSLSNHQIINIADSM